MQHRMPDQTSYQTFNIKEYKDKPLRLNLGSGNRLWPGFINIDAFNQEADIQADIKNLPIPNNCADEAHLIHVIEHVHRWETSDYIREVIRVLKPGGLLVIECPDLDKIALNLFSYLDADKPETRVLHDGREVNVIEDCKAGLYGDMKSTQPEMVHKWCFQQSELIDIMRECGCLSVSSVQPKYHRPFRDMRIEGVKA